MKKSKMLYAATNTDPGELRRKISPVLIAFAVIVLSVATAKATNYYTSTNGSPSSTNIWWTNTNGTGSHPSNFSNASDVFTIQNGDNMTTTASWTVAGTVVINNGGTLNVTSNSTTVSLGALTINSGGILNQRRDLTVNGATSISGTINFGSTSTTNRTMTFTGDVTLNSGAVWNETTTGAVADFAFGGNFTNNATTFTSQNSSAAVHIFSGTGKTIGGSTATSMYFVTISGTISLATSDLTVGNTLSLTGSGTLTTGSQKVIVSNSASGAVSIASGAGINGTIQRAIQAGNTGDYRFTNLNTFVTPNASQSAVTMTMTVYPNTLPPAGNTADAIRRYYDVTISPTSPTFTSTVRFAFVSSEIPTHVPSYSNSDFSLFRLTPGTTTWVGYGGAGVSYAGMLDNSVWSSFAFSVTSTALPIQLASFTGNVGNSGVELKWRTLSEVNNYGFYVQKRASGVSEWTEIEGSFIAGHGTTNTPQQYAYTDNAGILTATQYRLRQVDLDNTNHYTEPIEVDALTSVSEVAPKQFALKQNYPNPFNPSTEIKFSVEATGRATLDVYNAIGQKVATLFDGVAEAGQYYNVRFNATGFSSGIYFYRLSSGQKTDLKKLVLLK